MGGKQCSVRKEGNFLLLGTQERPPVVAASLESPSQLLAQESSRPVRVLGAGEQL